MRPAPSERQQAERFLELEGWTAVKIPKPLMRADLSETHLVTMLKWCEDHIGLGRVEPNDHYYDRYSEDVWYSFTWYGFYRFHFKHSKDAMAFTLRWL